MHMHDAVNTTHTSKVVQTLEQFQDQAVASDLSFFPSQEDSTLDRAET